MRHARRRQGREPGSVVGETLLLLRRKCRDEAEHVRFDPALMQRREALQAVQDVVILLAADSRYRSAVAAFRGLVVTGDASAPVSSLTHTEGATVAMIGPRASQRLR